jgi:LemA protein
VSLPATAPDDPAKLKEFEAAQAQLKASMAQMLLVVENYPDLKSSANFRDLQAQLEGTENRISVERNKFNEAVREYNTSIHSFPSMVFAGMFGFHDKPYFAADAGAQTVPAVKFDFSK